MKKDFKHILYILRDLKNMNKYSVFILKLTFQICVMLGGLCLFLHIFAYQAVSYITVVSNINALIETIGAVLFSGVVCALIGDLVLRQTIGDEKEETPEKKDDNDKK